MLDLTCGSPDLIKDVAQTWENISMHLGATRERFVMAVRHQTSTWEGTAAESYRATADRWGRLLLIAAKCADCVAWGQERQRAQRKTVSYVAHAIDEAIFPSSSAPRVSRCR